MSAPVSHTEPLSAPALALSADVPQLNSEGTNWAIFEARFQDAMETADRWEYFDGSEPHPVPADPNNPTEAEKQEMKHWDRQDRIAWNLLNKRLPDAMMLEVRQYPSAKERWDVVKRQFTAKSAYARKALHQSFVNMQCPKGGDVRAFLSSLTLRRNEPLAAGVTISDEDFEQTVLDGIPEALATYASLMLSQSQLDGKQREMKDIMHILLEEADHMKIRCTPKDHSQGKGKNQSQLNEALAVTTSDSSKKRRKGKCHYCKKDGHWARKCFTKKREKEAAQAQSGQAAQVLQTAPHD